MAPEFTIGELNIAPDIDEHPRANSIDDIAVAIRIRLIIAVCQPILYTSTGKVQRSLEDIAVQDFPRVEVVSKRN